MKLLQDSIIRVTSGKPDEGSFGTGFAFYRDEKGTYILTCAHVVNAVGGPKVVQADGIIASVIALGSEADVDLAVLRVEGLRAMPLLHLSATGKTGNNFTTVGFQLYQSSSKEIGFLSRPLHGILGEQVGVEARDVFIRIGAWDLRIRGDDKLEGGYSGSPVVDEESGDVIGVVSTRVGGLKGIAIAVKALTKIWPDMPSSLLKAAEPATIHTTNEASSTQRAVQTPGSTTELLTQEERKKLITLLCKLPDIEYANVRHSLVSNLPAQFQSNIAFDKSPEIHITEIVDIVISDASFPLPDGSYPIMVLIQNAINMMENSKLGGDLQSFLKILKERLEITPQMNTATTSLDSFIQYLDNFILQMPALEYELGCIPNSLSDSVASPECEVVSDHLHKICTQLLEIDIIVKQSRDLEVVYHRSRLMDALADFNQQATIVQKNIEHFCMANEVVLEEDQPIEELEKIQQQLDILILHYTTVLKTARKLFSDLLGSK